MITGSFLVAACLFVLGWTREIVEFFLGKFASVSAGQRALFGAVINLLMVTENYNGFARRFIYLCA